MKHVAIIIVFFSFRLLFGIPVEAQNKAKKNLPTYRYYHQSGDTLRILKISGIKTQKIHFTLSEKIGTSERKIIMREYAKMISDSEQEQNEKGEAVFSQEYCYETDSLIYSLRTDGEKNSFIRFQVYLPDTPASKPLRHYFMKQCKQDSLIH